MNLINPIRLIDYVVDGTLILNVPELTIYKTFTTKAKTALFIKTLKSQGFILTSKVAYLHALDVERALLFGDPQ